MRLRPFGSTGRHVPVIGQGTWMMERAPARSIEALRRGLALGLTHVDTAEMYGEGRVEELVGRAVADERDQVFLVSKVLPANASREGTIAACERSLRRLRTDRLDLYLLHWAGEHPVEETVAGFEALVQAGKILAYGVSNFDEHELEEAVRAAEPGRIACNQVLYHLEERAIEHAVLPWCAARGVAVVGYSPFAQGSFPGRSAVLREIAAAREATPRQVALAFLTRDPSTFTIPKASGVAHVEENAGAASLVLTGEELGRLEAAFPRGPRPAELPTL